MLQILQVHPARKPDIEMGARKIWRLPLRDTSPHALATYVIYAPHAHAFWHWRLASLVDLKDAADSSKANKSYPEAAYEFVLLSLDPGVALGDID